MNYLKVAIFALSLLLFVKVSPLLIVLLFFVLFLLKRKKEKLLLLIILGSVYATTKPPLHMVDASSIIVTVSEIKSNYLIAKGEYETLLVYLNDEQISYRDVLEINGKIEKIQSIDNFYTFGFQEYMNHKQIYRSITPKSYKVIKKQFDLRNIVLKYIRSQKNQRVKQRLEQLFIFRKYQLNEEQGISFSLLLTAFYQLIVSKKHDTKRRRIFLHGLLFIFHLFLVGVVFTLVRICITGLVGAFHQNKFNLVGGVMILSLIFFPNIIEDFTFQLYVLLQLYFLFGKQKPKWNTMLLFLFLQMYFMKTINLLFLVLFPIIRVMYGMLYALHLLLFFSPMQRFVLLVIEKSELLLLWISNFQFPIQVVIPFYMVILYTCISLFVPSKKRIMAMIALFIGFGLHQFVSVPKIVYFSIGQGDFILVDFGFQQKKVIVDCGATKEMDTYQRYVQPYLKAHGIKIDEIYISHDDFDHNGALEDLLVDYPNAKVITHHNDVNPDLFLSLNEKDEQKEQNDQSLVLWTVIGNYHYLFTGDISKQMEERLLQAYPSLQVDVLKVAHHGSATSTSPRFIQTVQPQYSIISVKSKNIYGHPHQTTLETLQDSGTKILSTAEHGAIEILHYPFFKIIRTVHGEFDIIW